MLNKFTPNFHCRSLQIKKWRQTTLVVRPACPRIMFSYKQLQEQELEGSSSVLTTPMEASQCSPHDIKCTCTHQLQFSLGRLLFLSCTYHKIEFIATLCMSFAAGIEEEPQQVCLVSDFKFCQGGSWTCRLEPDFTEASQAACVK